MKPIIKSKQNMEHKVKYLKNHIEVHINTRLPYNLDMVLDPIFPGKKWGTTILKKFKMNRNKGMSSVREALSPLHSYHSSEGIGDPHFSDSYRVAYTTQTANPNTKWPSQQREWRTITTAIVLCSIRK